MKVTRHFTMGASPPNPRKKLSPLRFASRSSKLVRDQRGATMVEYAILLFLVLVVAAAVYRSVGKKVRQAGDMTAQQFN